MKKRFIFLITVLLSLFVTGCKYDFILPVPEVPVTGDISFSTQVAPIFSAGNKCTSCHKAGGQSPDFTTAAAYASIVPALVSTTADQSMIYTFPGPTTATHSWKKLTTGEAAIILQWIKQGAKNN